MRASLASLLLALVVARVGATTIDEYPTGVAFPGGATPNVADSTLWFAYDGGLGRISTAGVSNTFGIGGVPTPRLVDATLGADGNMWGTERNTSRIVSFTTGTTPAYTEYSTGLTVGAIPYGICSIPAGDLWFCERGNDAIARITTAGVITEFPVPTNAEPRYICLGSDGKLWFTAPGLNQVGRLDPASPATAPTMFAAGAGSQPLGICPGPDTALWFTEPGSGKIGRLTTGGTLTEFTVPTAASTPYGICTGPDGNLWFCETAANNLVRLTTSGVFSEIPLTTASSGPTDVAAGPDGKLWVTEESAGKIARVDPASVGATTSSSASAGSGTSVTLPTNSGGSSCGMGSGVLGLLGVALALALGARRSLRR